MNISKLKENPLNSEIYGESDVKELVDRIESSGYIKAILVKPDNTIISGHRRVAACKGLGIVDIDAEVISGKTDLEYEELFLLENANRIKTKSQLISEYDMWEEIEAKRAEIRMKAGKEIDPMGKTPIGSGTSRDLAAEHIGKKDGKTQEQNSKVLKSVKELPKEEQKVVIDIFNNKISDAKKLVEMTGDKRKDVLSVIDSGEAKSVKEAVKSVESNDRKEQVIGVELKNIINGNAVEEIKKLESDSIDCVVSDPPYGVDYVDSRESFNKQYIDKKDYALKLLDDTCKELKRVCKEGSHMYFFTGYSNMFEFKEILSKYFTVQDNPIVWVKNNHTLCDFDTRYASKYEMIWFCTNGTFGKRKLNYSVSPDVMQYAIPTNKKHSAQKPVELLEYLIKNSTVDGEVVLDPFAGSGSTVIASRNCNRNYIAIELEKDHYDNILWRLENE